MAFKYKLRFRTSHRMSLLQKSFHPYFLFEKLFKTMSTINNPRKIDPIKGPDTEKDAAGRDDLSCGVASHVDTPEVGNVADPVLAAKIHLVNKVWTRVEQSHLHLTLSL